jgi:hypothetical protein
MRDMAGGPRVLLKRLRELMAEPLEPQDRLDRIVHDIAQNMVAEVCSLYVLRADSVLELYATEGLNPGSVHLAQLRLGQGLVGTIAASARNRATILAMGLYPSVDAVYGPDEGPWFVVFANTAVRFEGGQQARGATFVAHGSEIQPARGHGFTVARDRLWYIAVDGSLASVEVPWKGGAR